MFTVKFLALNDYSFILLICSFYTNLTKLGILFFSFEK
jgi:hypothetical protein